MGNWRRAPVLMTAVMGLLSNALLPGSASVAQVASIYNEASGPYFYSVGSYGGYAVRGHNVTDVKGTWVVPPQVNCGALKNATSQVLIWVGIGGFRTPLEQTGVSITCDSGGKVVDAFSFIEFWPAPAIPLSVFGVVDRFAPGDVMTGEVKYTEKTNASGALIFEFLLTDQPTDKKRKGWHFSLEDVSNALRGTPYYPTLASLNSADWAVEPCCQDTDVFVPLAPFGSITFTDASATIGNESGPINKWNYIDLELCLSQTNTPGYGGPLTTATSTPLTSAGDSFSIIWGDMLEAMKQGPARKPQIVYCYQE
jgi:hypothetical protein